MRKQTRIWCVFRMMMGTTRHRPSASIISWGRVRTGLVWRPLAHSALHDLCFAVDLAVMRRAVWGICQDWTCLYFTVCALVQRKSFWLLGFLNGQLCELGLNTEQCAALLCLPLPLSVSFPLSDIQRHTAVCVPCTGLITLPRSVVHSEFVCEAFWQLRRPSRHKIKHIKACCLVNVVILFAQYSLGHTHFQKSQCSDCLTQLLYVNNEVGAWLPVLVLEAAWKEDD